MEFGKPVLPPEPEKRKRTRVGGSDGYKFGDLQSAGEPAPNVGTAPLLETEHVETPAAKVYGAKQRTRSAIAKSAVSKGASGEREVLTALRDVMTNIEAELRDDGYEFVPRSEFCNRRRLEKGRSREDISGVPLISIEVKRNENLNVGKAWEQATSQATERRLPVLVYKFNREAWRVRTWLAFTTPHGSIAQYCVAETTLPDFLTYYAGIYRAFLAEGLK